MYKKIFALALILAFRTGCTSTLTNVANSAAFACVNRGATSMAETGMPTVAIPVLPNQKGGVYVDTDAVLQEIQKAKK